MKSYYNYITNVHVCGKKDFKDFFLFPIRLFAVKIVPDGGIAVADRYAYN